MPAIVVSLRVRCASVTPFASTTRAGFRRGTAFSTPDAERAPVANTDSSTVSIVLIDDDASLQTPLSLLVQEALGNRTVLRQERYGAAGARLVEALEPDLIILDLKLPDVDGLSVLKLLKASPVLRQIPVIVITGEANWQMLGICIDAGAETYMFKPLDAEKFIAAVRSAYERRPRRGDGRTGIAAE